MAPNFSMHARTCLTRSVLWAACLLLSGCAAIPQVRHQPQFHNPFPQLHRVAILPFFNLSSEPTVNQDEVAEAYYNELQGIPGFEVMPPGVQRAARFLPLTHVVTLVKGLWFGETWTRHLTEVAILSSIMILSARVAASVFRWE